MENDTSRLVSVLSTNNYGTFVTAKSILDYNKIKFSTTGEFLNNVEAPVYPISINVSERDEKKARQVLRGINKEEKYPESKPPVLTYLVVAIAAIIIVVALLVLSMK